MSETPSTELSIVDVSSVDTRALLESFNTPNGRTVSTFKPASFADRKMILKAVMNAVPLSDHLNEPLHMIHFIVQEIQVNAADTGKPRSALRTIILTDDGNAYAAVSDGIARALSTIRAMMGEPDNWLEPVTVVASKERAAVGSYFTLTVLD